MQTKIKRIMDKLFYHESWDIMLIKDNGTHSFPDNTLEILSKSTAQQLKKKYTFQADPFLIEKGDNCMFSMKLLAFATQKARYDVAFLTVNWLNLKILGLKALTTYSVICHSLI